MGSTKVCHITTVHPNRYDGRIFERECTSLKEAGFDVTLIVNDGLPDEIKNGVQIISIAGKGRDLFSRLSNVKKAYIKAMQVNADLYHLHDPELLLIARKLSKQGKKVIFDSHEFTAMQILTKEYIPSIFRKIISHLYAFFETRVLKKIDGVICPCTVEGKDYFSRININKAIIGNYAPKEIIESATADLSRDESEKKVCYVGSICETRGALCMIKAIARAKRKLVLIGTASDELLEKMKAMPEFKHVEFWGQLPHSEALRIIKSSYLGLSLLKDEGQYQKIDNLPTKVYEYMQLGLPVVISNSVYVNRVMKKYRFGIAVDPNDSQAVADAINDILDNEALYHSMSEEGKRAISEEMNWENESKNLIAFYEKVFE